MLKRFDAYTTMFVLVAHDIDTTPYNTMVRAIQNKFVIGPQIIVSQLIEDCTSSCVISLRSSDHFGLSHYFYGGKPRLIDRREKVSEQ